MTYVQFFISLYKIRICKDLGSEKSQKKQILFNSNDKEMDSFLIQINTSAAPSSPHRGAKAVAPLTYWCLRLWPYVCQNRE